MIAFLGFFVILSPSILRHGFGGTGWQSFISYMSGSFVVRIKLAVAVLFVLLFSCLVVGVENLGSISLDGA